MGMASFSVVAGIDAPSLIPEKWCRVNSCLRIIHEAKRHKASPGVLSETERSSIELNLDSAA